MEIGGGKKRSNVVSIVVANDLRKMVGRSN